MVRKIIGKTDFPCNFKTLVTRFKEIGYNMNILLQTACMIVNPIMVDNFASLINCVAVGRSSAKMTTPSSISLTW